VTLSFGTDGIRGDSRTELTAPLVRALARAGAEVLGADLFVVGRDPRQSGPELAAAVHAGVADAGGRSVDLGVLPTPAVAHWCASRQVAGAMISASHNPWFDNGIKFFAAGGRKLTDQAQDAIQTRFEQLLQAEAEPASVSTSDEHETASAAYRSAVLASVQGRSLSGLRVVVDGANGAGSMLAPQVLRDLGVEVISINVEPSGTNINEACGSTHPEALCDAVVLEGADLGLALDGDADRVLAVDSSGALVDGDQLMAICALDAHARGQLAGPAVVVTVMSNLGFRRAMAEAGIEVVTTAVGDRHVLEALDARGLSLGGEQSGHVIFRDLATTGDGLLTAVQLLDVVARSGRTLRELAQASMTRLPQVLRSVPVSLVGNDLDDLLGPLVDAASARLGEQGRVLVRPSGTEPLVRVMVEAETDAEAQFEADGLAAAIAALLG
jgi:phosphoglucosamine mutase